MKTTKKKVTTKNAVVLHHPDGKVIDKNEFKSILTDSANEIYRLLQVNDNDNAVQLMYKSVIQASYKLLGKIESHMEESDSTRGAYPFNAVATTLRDYLTDLQASMDRGNLAQSILDNILRPLFLEMATQIVIELGNIGKEAKLSMKPREFEDFKNNVLRSSQEKMIQTLQRSYETAKDEARKALQK